MYNLIISADEEAWERPRFVLDAERFLEYTDDELKRKFKALDETAKKTLMRLPTIFAYESPVPKPARVGSLNTIEKQGREIRITYSFNPSVEPVDPERVRAVVWNALEMTRTHWAVKDGDVLDVLAPLKGAQDKEPALPAEEPTYSFSRQTLLTACDTFKALSHAGFDRFLLEVGIDAIKAKRDRGGLAARATALAEFVVKNPAARTIEGELLGLRVARQSAELLPVMPDNVRKGFQSALERDGYEIRDGRVIPVTTATIKSIEIDASFVRPSAHTAVAPIPPVPETSTPPAEPMRSTPPTVSTKVFLVHGRDDAAKHEVAYYLAKLGLEPVILHERPSKGRTLITKFCEEAEGATYAVVLMTPDDVGGIKGEMVKTGAPRARQNVVFELGFFIGKLGPERVCALLAGEVQKPSDFDGVVYVSFGTNRNWRGELARELHAAGLPFDPAKAL